MDQEAGVVTDDDRARFFELSRSLFAVVTPQGRLLRLNPSWEHLLGRPLDDMLGRSFKDFLHPDDLDRTMSFLRSQDGKAAQFENRYLHADGSSVWLRWDTQVAADGSAVWCIARDVTVLRRRLEQQTVVADLGRQALEGSSLEDLLASAVDALYRGLDFPLAAVLARRAGELEVQCSRGLPTVPAVVLPHDGSTLTSRCIREGRTLTDTDLLEHATSSHREFRARGALAVPIGKSDQPWGALVGGDVRPRVIEDAEVRFVEQVAHVLGAAIERQDIQARLQHEATHDTLTGLPNRELLRDRMNTALRHAQRTGQAVGLLLCDLDGFKDVNDSLGHAAGDAVLQQLANRLHDTVGPADTVARLGGDEFAICVVGPATELEVLGVADAVIRAMRQPFSLPGLDVPLSTSIGVVVSPTHGRDASTLLKHADVAMYRAKSGHLGWTLYDASVDGARSDRLTLTADLRGAIATDALQLHYQPVVDLTTGRLHSVEALCRWEHEDRGTVTPSTFIPLAEQTGVVLGLTTWVVRQAAAQARRWQAAGHPVRCAVNLSMAAVADDRASAELIDALVRSSSLLTVEITESWLVDARGREVIAELADAGVALALDDFGTGFSSLAALTSFPVQQLKLDRQLVRELDEDPRGHDVLRAVVDLASALGMEVVGEGVETERTAARLRAAGLHLGQGLRWSAAVPAPELEAWAGWPQMPAKQRA